MSEGTNYYIPVIETALDELADAAQGWPTPNGYTEACDNGRSALAALAARLEAAETASRRAGSALEALESDFSRIRARAVAAEGERDEARANETAWAKTSATGQAALKRTRLRAEAAEGRLKALDDEVRNALDVLAGHTIHKTMADQISAATRILNDALARAVLAGGDGQDPHCRDCPDCGKHDLREMEDDSWICHSCGHVVARGRDEQEGT